MPGPMGEKCENCYWLETGDCFQPKTGICHHSALFDCNGISDRPYTWWCDHFDDRERHKRALKQRWRFQDEDSGDN
jgi:hypothetical protein